MGLYKGFAPPGVKNTIFIIWRILTNTVRFCVFYGVFGVADLIYAIIFSIALHLTWIWDFHLNMGIVFAFLSGFFWKNSSCNNSSRLRQGPWHYPWRLRQNARPLAPPLTVLAKAQALGTTLDNLDKSPGPWHYPWRLRQMSRPLALPLERPTHTFIPCNS